MDIAQARLRSASHGSLHNAYKAHGTTNSGPRPPCQRRPLRSVKENATLLRSPGPLESMLKTTTETGDIGVFSFQARASPSTAGHQPRPCLGDVGLVLPPYPKLYEDGFCQDEHRRLRSYRDTTSEIISLYGSDNQQYWLRSASPTLDDAHRSYSLTTCSSRQIPSQKSSGTLQSHSSGGGLQRPRSPFPYPTRLKRPGVRPASPALAENGGIDYSRMVELDRVSQRTIHGSYKPTYAHGPRRPPPLSLRADINRSTASLPSRASPGLCHFVPGPNRIRTPSSSLSGMPRPYDRIRGGSADQSVRSASLTSIVDMYHRPITASSAGQPLRPGGSFYYDYSEEFDKPVAPLNPGTELEAPLCPIPQRTGSNSRPMVLRDDTEAQLDAVRHDAGAEGASALQDQQQGDSPVPIETIMSEAHHPHGHGHSIRSIDDILKGTSPDSSLHDNSFGAEDAEKSGLAALVQRQDNSHSAPPISEPRVTNVHVYAAPPRLEFTKNHEKPLSTRRAWRLSKTLGAEPDLSESLQDKRASQSSLSKLRCTLDPALSEFASLFSSFDRLAKTPFSRRGDDTTTIDDEPCTSSRGEEEEEDDEDEDKERGLPKRLGRRPSLQLFSVAAAESSAYRRRHRRNAAAMRINTAGLHDFGATRQGLSPPKEELTILSPEPISPIRQLRVKNSIPQLMKALPPLPREAAGASSPNGQGSPAAAEHFTSHARHELSLTDKVCLDKSLSGEVHLALAANTQGEVQASPPKLRIRARASSSSSRVSDVGPLFKNLEREQQGHLQQSSNSAAKPKLKLKLSRSRLGQARTGHGSSVFRTNRLKQCNSLADLAGQSRRDAYAGPADLRDDVECRPKSAAGDGAWESREEGIDEPEPSPQPSDQFNIPYPPSPDKAEALARSSTSTSKATLSEMRSFHSDVNPVGHRGLRQKLSMFRLRITGTSATGASKGGSDTVPALDARTSNKSSEASGEAIGEAKGRAISTRSERVGGRVRRWASDAKQAVRSYVRRTLDRSSRLSG